MTITATTAGTAGNSITTTETLAGFSWGGATLAGGTNGEASIVAFNNLYDPSCNSGTPTTSWAYNTGGTVVTSPVLSLDGTQVAFVHTHQRRLEPGNLETEIWRGNGPGASDSGHNLHDRQLLYDLQGRRGLLPAQPDL